MTTLRFKVKQTADALVDGLQSQGTSSSNERSLKGNQALNPMSASKTNTSSTTATNGASTTSIPTSVPSVNAIRLGFIKHCNLKNQQQITGVISMHKFIKSKGKTVTNLSRFASHQNLCFNSNTNDYSLQVLSSTGGSNEHRGIIGASDAPSVTMPSTLKAVRKGTTPAESKIQAEMREMKAREEELR